jgi:hypothetical protein
MSSLEHDQNLSGKGHHQHITIGVLALQGIFINYLII